MDLLPWEDATGSEDVEETVAPFERWAWELAAVVEEEVGHTAAVVEEGVGRTAVVEEEAVGRTAVAEAEAAAAEEEEVGRTAVAAVEEVLRVVEVVPKPPKRLQTWLDAYQEVPEVVHPAP